MNNRKNYEKEEKRKLLNSICVGTMVEIQDFDSTKMKVNVQPLIKEFSNNGYVDPSPILDVPVACLVGGKTISKPEYEKGDIGLVLFLDSDFSDVIESGKLADPATERTHSNTDAIFIGGLVPWSESLQVPTGGHVISTLDGKVNLVLSEEGINLEGKTNIKGNLSIDGQVSVNGDVNINGNIYANNI